MTKKSDFLSVAAGKPTVALYYRPSGSAANAVEQRSAYDSMRAIAAQHGIPMSKATVSGDLPHFDEQSAEAGLALSALQTKLGRGDTLICSKVADLGRVPSVLLKRLETFVAKGVRVLIAELGGEPSLPHMRTYLSPFTAMEQALVEAEQALVEQAESHAVEMQEAIAAHQREFLNMLDARGMSLSDLMGIAAPQTSGFDRGRELRRLRSECGLTMEQAGQLVEPAIAKGTISRFESGTLGGQFDRYEVALTAHAFKVRQKSEAEAAEAATDRDLMRRLNEAGLTEEEEISILADLQKSISEPEGPML